MLDGRPNHPPKICAGEQLELFARAPFSLRLKFDDALRIFVETYWSKLPSYHTTRKHLARLSEFFKDRFIDTISKADVEDYRRWLKSMNLSEPTINKGHMVLTRMFSKFFEYKDAGEVYGVDYRNITLPARNPGSMVPKVNERTFARKVVFSRPEIYHLIETAIQLGDMDMAQIIDALYLSRLRLSDFKRLTSESVEPKKRLLIGVQHKTITRKTPSGIPYTVVMSDPLYNLVTERLNRIPAGRPLFPFKNIQKRWEAVRKAARLGFACLSDLRRSAASYLLDHAVDPYTVAEGLGHTSLRMLPWYTPRFLKHQQEASDLLAG